jgi:hypothetical protein
MKLLFLNWLLDGHNDTTTVLIVIFYVVASVGLVVSYFLRAIPPFNWIWGFFKWILITILVILSVNFLKKEVKSWWSK